MKKRNENEQPLAIIEWGWKYHHIGVPTNRDMPGSTYLPHLKFSVCGFDTSPFGVEWMKFDENCEIHELIQSVPHIAFQVDDLEKELRLRNLNIIVEPNSPSQSAKVAFIKYNGAPIELIEFIK